MTPKQEIQKNKLSKTLKIYGYNPNTFDLTEANDKITKEMIYDLEVYDKDIIAFFRTIEQTNKHPFLQQVDEGNKKVADQIRAKRRKIREENRTGVEKIVPPEEDYEPIRVVDNELKKTTGILKKPNRPYKYRHQKFDLKLFTESSDGTSQIIDSGKDTRPKSKLNLDKIIGDDNEAQKLYLQEINNILQANLKIKDIFEATKKDIRNSLNENDDYIDDYLLTKFTLQVIEKEIYLYNLEKIVQKSPQDISDLFNNTKRELQKQHPECSKYQVTQLTLQNMQEELQTSYSKDDLTELLPPPQNQSLNTANPQLPSFTNRTDAFRTLFEKKSLLSARKPEKSPFGNAEEETTTSRLTPDSNSEQFENSEQSGPKLPSISKRV